jgi:hypothetical protein
MKRTKKEDTLKKILKLLEGKYTLCIERTENGVVLRYHNSYQYDSENYTECFDFGDEDNFDVEKFKQFIDSVIEEFQPSTRWKEKRVSTYISHGHKYECVKKDCQICAAEKAVYKQEGIDLEKDE